MTYYFARLCVPRFILPSSGLWFYYIDQDEYRAEPKPDASGLYVMHKADKHSSSNYAWDCPSARDKRLLLNINGKDRGVDILEIGSLLPFKFPVRVLVQNRNRPIDFQ